jgi:multidrug efflux pump subunit AcrA (membrane-fusion protein)
MLPSTNHPQIRYSQKILRPHPISKRPSQFNVPVIFGILLISVFFLIVSFCFAQVSDETVFRVEPAHKEIVLTGYTRSKTNMVVSSEVSGKVVAVNYDVGDTIGQKPVVEMDSTFIDFQIQNLQHSIQLLENSLEKAHERVRYLEKEFNRIDTLYKENRASEINRDAAEQEVTQARLQKNSVSIEKSKLEISLSELLERKKRHQIFVHSGWQIVDKIVETGEQIIQGTPLARASDFRKLVVPLSVSAEELTAIRALPAQFSANLEQEIVKATIRWINPDFDETTRKLRIELLLSEYNGENRGGLRFTLPLKIPSRGLRIPKVSVLSRYENPRVKIKATQEMVNVLVMGETGEYLIIAEDSRLLPGTELESFPRAQ